MPYIDWAMEYAKMDISAKKLFNAQTFFVVKKCLWETNKENVNDVLSIVLCQILFEGIMVDLGTWL